MRRRIIPILALTAGTLATAYAGTAHAAIDGFGALLNGASEVPGPGDTDGIGVALVIPDSTAGEVCVRLRVRNIDPATAAHIHVGTSTQAGPVVIHLPAPTSGRSAGCVAADKALLQRIIDNPENYYVNVHNPAFPGGAVRGQLG